MNWNRHDIAELLSVDPAGTGRWRSRHGDVNMNGRSYGGQLLGQAMAAALRDVPEQREATMMQFLFLQGAMPQEVLEFQVTNLQEGKRFSARHVRASQESGRTVLDAHIACAVELDAPTHSTPSSAPPSERPEDLPGPKDVDPALLLNLQSLGGYARDRKPSIDFRIPEPDHQFHPEAMDGSFRFWMRASRPLSTDPRVHAAAFAYLSDWWLNFSSLGLHLHGLGQRKVYIASLNHAIWLHRPVRADQWLHVRTKSPGSAGGRGLSIGAVHDLEGLHLATLSQECLMAYAD